MFNSFYQRTLCNTHAINTPLNLSVTLPHSIHPIINTPYQPILSSTGIAIRSLIYDKHGSWYSWCIATLTGSFYTLSFTMSVPQLIINHRLKSVSALPWRYLVYKFINTFIDDLFAFIIKMPTMHRISVFRDDIIFVIYIYQRWIYRIDESRPAEK